MAVFQSNIIASEGTVFAPNAFENRVGTTIQFHGHEAIVQGVVVIENGREALLTLEVPGVNSEKILPTANL